MLLLPFFTLKDTTILNPSSALVHSGTPVSHIQTTSCRTANEKHRSLIHIGASASHTSVFVFCEYKALSIRTHAEKALFSRTPQKPNAADAFFACGAPFKAIPTGLESQITAQERVRRSECTDSRQQWPQTTSPIEGSKRSKRRAIYQATKRLRVGIHEMVKRHHKSETQLLMIDVKLSRQRL